MSSTITLITSAAESLNHCGSSSMDIMTATTSPLLQLAATATATVNPTVNGMTHTSATSPKGSLSVALAAPEDPLVELNTVKKLQPYFKYTIKEAANKLGVCPSALKEKCRALRIPRWPYRKLISFDQHITKLRLTSQLSSPSQRAKDEKKIEALEKMKQAVLDNPHLAKVFDKRVVRSNTLYKKYFEGCEDLADILGSGSDNEDSPSTPPEMSGSPRTKKPAKSHSTSSTFNLKTGSQQFSGSPRPVALQQQYSQAATPQAVHSDLVHKNLSFPFALPSQQSPQMAAFSFAPQSNPPMPVATSPLRKPQAQRPLQLQLQLQPQQQQQTPFDFRSFALQSNNTQIEASITNNTAKASQLQEPSAESRQRHAFNPMYSQPTMMFDSGYGQPQSGECNQVNTRQRKASIDFLLN